MSPRSLEADLADLHEAAGGDPIEAANDAGALLTDHLRHFIVLIRGGGSGRVAAAAAYLEVVERSVRVVEEALEPGEAGRANTLAALELLIASVNQLAPAVVRALTDEDAEVRRAAARAVRAILAAPAVAASARRAAEHHPDPTVRDLLAEKP